MRISRMHKGDYGKVRAFFDLETAEGLTVKGFKIIEGSDGLFIGYPSKQNRDGEYSDTVWAAKELKQEISKLALTEYGREVLNAPPQSTPPQDDDIPF